MVQETMPCVKSYDPRLIFAWPSAELAVMGASCKSLGPNRSLFLKSKGEVVDEAKEAELFAK
jgi:acetyl-CoA carboxylase carboxyltransferase component